MQEPVEPVVLPPLVEHALVVHVEDRLEEAAAQHPEVRVVPQLSQLHDPAAARARERRAVGAALRLAVGQLLVDQDQRDRVVTRHRTCVVFHVVAIDTHDLDRRPWSVIVWIIIDLAAGTVSVRGRKRTRFGRVINFCFVPQPIRVLSRSHI